MALDPHEYRRALGQFPTGVTIVTARAAQGGYMGLTANSFTSVSLEPALVSWSLRCGSSLFEAFSRTGHFAVNVLAANQTGLAERFAARRADRFAGLKVVEGIAGVPLVEGCIAQFECVNVACHVAGDHGIFIGRVERYTSAGSGQLPLVFCQGGYMAPRSMVAA